METIYGWMDVSKQVKQESSIVAHSTNKLSSKSQFNVVVNVVVSNIMINLMI